MDAVKFLKERKRMCDSYPIICGKCKISEAKDGLHCYEFQYKFPERAVAIVEKWSEEHPQETRLSRFLKYYPNAELNNDGTPREICAHKLGIREFKGCLTESCVDCWNTPIKEE
jgi:hypothetical protein